MGRFKRNDNGSKPNNGNRYTYKKKTGAPSLYDPLYHPQRAYELCCERGYFLEDLAVALGIPYNTLTTWWWKHADFKEAIRAGRDKYDTEHVENALLKRALGYEYQERKTEEITVQTRRQDGVLMNQPAVRTTTTTKQVLPNVTAMFFWLVNRSSGRWQHIQNVKVDLDGKLESSGKVQVMDWSLVGKALGIDKLEELRRILTALPAGSSNIADHSGGGQAAGGK